MKLKMIVLLMMSAFFAGAQTFTLSAKSGDTELDASLSEMNASAKLDLGAFKAKISTDFKLSGTKIDLMLGTMSPADVFMNAQVSVIIGKPVDDVIVVYNKNKGKGWGVIAKELGIKPGSKEFHRLKDATKTKNKELKGNSKAKAKKATGKSGKGNSGKGNGKSKK